MQMVAQIFRAFTLEKTWLTRRSTNPITHPKNVSAAGEWLSTSQRDCLRHQQL